MSIFGIKLGEALRRQARRMAAGALAALGAAALLAGPAQAQTYPEETSSVVASTAVSGDTVTITWTGPEDIPDATQRNGQRTARAYNLLVDGSVVPFASLLDVTEVRLGVQITHKRVGDLQLSLRHPGGKEVRLLNKNLPPSYDAYSTCIAGAMNVTFRDTQADGSAVPAITSACRDSARDGLVPIVGDFKPEQPLNAAFTPLKMATDSSSTWQFVAIDLGGGDLGKLDKVTLTLVTTPLPTISLLAAPTLVTEGADLMFTLTATAPLSTAGPAVVPVVISQTGSYLRGAIPDTVTFPANGRAATLNLATEDDDLYEADGTVSLSLGPPTASALFIPASADGVTVTVEDNDSIGISILDGGANESERSIDLVVTLTHPAPAGGVTLEVTTSDGSATGGSATDVMDKKDGVDYQSLMAHTVTLSQGQLAATLNLQVANDTASEGAETFTATIANPNATEPVAIVNGSAEFTLYDNDMVSVVNISAGTAVQEGSGNAVFTITVEPPPAGDLTVPLLVSQTGNYLLAGDLGPTSVTVPANASSATLALIPVDDNTDEADGALMVALDVAGLLSDASPGANRSASVDITDNDDPPWVVVLDEAHSVYTVRVAPGVLEARIPLRLLPAGGGPADGPPSDKPVVILHGTVSDSFHDHTAMAGVHYEAIAADTELRFPPGATAQTLVVRLLEAPDDSLDDTFAVEFRPHDGSAQLASRDELGDWSVRERRQIEIVLEDRLASLGIAAEQATASEGAELVYTLTASRVLSATGPTPVPVTVSQRGKYLMGDAPTEVMFPAGASAAELRLATQDDQTYEADGAVTVSLAADAMDPPRWGVPAGQGSAAIQVIDDEDLPFIIVHREVVSPAGDVLRVMPDASTSRELAIQLRLLPAHCRRMPVGGCAVDGAISDVLLIAQYRTMSGEGYSAEAGVDYDAVTFLDSNNEVRFPPGASTATAMVTIRMDDADHIEDSFTVEFSGGSEGGDGRLGGRFAEGAVLRTYDSRELEVILTEAMPVLPTLSIEADETSVDEGLDLLFTLRASHRLSRTETVAVPVTFSEMGDFLRKPLPTAVAFAPGASSARLRVATVDDDAVENDGSVTVTLQPDSMAPARWQLDEAKNINAEVQLTDYNDPPAEAEYVVALTATARTVGEGGSFPFTFRVEDPETGAPTTTDKDLDVRLELSGGDGYRLTPAAGVYALKIPSGRSAVTYYVAVNSDAVDQPNVPFTLRILPGAVYDLGGAAAADHEVEIIDDDGPPLVALIPPVSGTVVEGAELRFLVQTSMQELLSTTGPVTVPVQVSQSGNYIAGVSGTLVTMEAVFEFGDYSAELRIPTQDDNTDEANGSIAVTLLEDAGLSEDRRRWGLSGNYSYQATVEDNEETPFVLVWHESLDETQLQVSEHAGQIEIALWLVPAMGAAAGAVSDREIVLGYRTQDEDGSAKAGTDFQAIPVGTRLTFAPGVNALKITVTGIQPDDDEMDDNFRLVFTPANGNGVPGGYRGGRLQQAGERATRTLEIILQEKPTVGIAATARTVTEGGDAVFRVSVMPAAYTAALTLTVNVSQEGQFVESLEPRTVVIAANQTSALLTIATDDDQVHEVDGKVIARLADLPADHSHAVASGPAELVVTDDDDAPTLEVAVVNTTEGGELVWTLSLPVPVGDGKGFALNWSVAAAEGVLMPTGATSGVLPFAPGDMAQSITVMTQNNTTQGPAEAVTLTLAAASDADAANVVLPSPAQIPQGMVMDDDAPILAIAAAAESVEEGETAVFNITVDYRDSTADKPALTVTLAVAERPRLHLPDFPASVTITIGASAETHAYSIAIGDDETPEAHSELTVSFADAEAGRPYEVAEGAGSATIMILDNDGLQPGQVKALHEAILPHVGVAIANQTAGALGDRVQAAYRGDGAQQMSGALQALRDAPVPFLLGALKTNRKFNLADLAFTHSFGSNPQPIPAKHAPANWRGAGIQMPGNGLAASGSMADRDAWHGATAWLKGYHTSLDVDETDADHGAIDFDGEVTGIMLGVDTLWHGTLLGLAYNSVSSDMEWQGFAADFSGTHETSLAGFHPYLAHSFASGLQLWGSFGYERGSTEVTADDRPEIYKNDLEHRVYAFGLYSPLCDAQSAASDVCMGVVAEAVGSRMTTDDIEGAGSLDLRSRWLRVGMDVRYARTFGGDKAFSTYAELTARRDDGDARKGSGLEYAGGVDFALPSIGLRFDLALRGRTLLTQGDEVEEWGLSGGIAWTGYLGARSFSLTFKPEYGTLASQQQGIWNGAAAQPAATAALSPHRPASNQPGLKYTFAADLTLTPHLTAGYETLLRTPSPEAQSAYLRYERRF